MTILHLNEGRHCENLTETINMDTWLQASLPAFEKRHSAHRQQSGHTLNWVSLFLLGNFYGLGNFSGLCVKVHCKHLLSLCMIHIYKVSELSMGNWAEKVQERKQQDALSSPSHCCDFNSSDGVVWALSGLFTQETPEPELVHTPVGPWLESWQINVWTETKQVCIDVGCVSLDEMFGSHWWLLPCGERWRKRVFSPAFLCCLALTLLSLENGGKVRKQYGAVVQSSHCESGKAYTLFHIHHSLMSFRGHGQWTLLAFLG